MATYLDSRPPNTILISPELERWVKEEKALSAIASPGHMVELHLDTTQKIRKAAAEDENPQMLVLMNDPENNKTWTDAYASGDVAPYAWIGVGYVFTGRIASTGSIAELAKLELGAGGLLKAAGATTATANVSRFHALEAQADGTADGSEILLKVQRIC